MNGKRAILAWIVGLSALAIATRTYKSYAPPPVYFRDVTDSAGIRFVHFNDGRCSIVPEDVGSGLAWGDYDGDGDDDLYLANFSGCLLRNRSDLQTKNGGRLYRNQGDGTFTDITELAELQRADWDNACLWFDYDQDGQLDLAITHYSGITLYRNNGDGTFQDMTTPSGLSSVNRYLLGMTVSDYDKDGDLDLYLCGYLRFDREAARAVAEGGKRPLINGRLAVWTNPVPYRAELNPLLRNNGDGTFTDVTDFAGVGDPNGKSMQAVFADFDNDGWVDLYVGNDVSTADVLFQNQKNGKFREISMPAGTHDFRATMGIAIGDVWRRGWLDLATTHWLNEDHGLWKNVSSDVGMLAFDDMAPALLPPKSLDRVGWGCGFFDFNNDTYLDFMVVNGSTLEEETSRVNGRGSILIPQSAQLNIYDTSKSRFVSSGSSAGALFERNHSSRGAAFDDYDRDGKIDVAVVHHGERARLYRNESNSGNHWLEVRLQGAVGNRNAISARVRVRAGPVVQMREILCGSSYLSQDSLIAHFGLGSSPVADRIEVKFYPSGKTQELNNVKADQIVVIDERSQ